MWQKIGQWIIRLWKHEEPIDPAAPRHQPVGRNVDTSSIRKRIQGIGWQIKEIPIVKSDDEGNKHVARWKLIAHKNMQSVEVGGSNIDEAMRNIGQVLGVIGKEHVA